MVEVAGPPPKRTPKPRHWTLAAGTALTRIYDRTYLRPAEYNHNGPRGRFDHHADVLKPADDPLHGVYYAADDLAGCIIEVFGDSGVIDLRRTYGVAHVTVPRDMSLLDLNGDGAWNAGSVAALTKHCDRGTTQSWARYFYDESGTYGRIDGVRYENGHNNAQAYVLFERAGTLRVLDDRLLADPALETEVFTIADRLHLLVDS